MIRMGGDGAAAILLCGVALLACKQSSSSEGSAAAETVASSRSAKGARAPSPAPTEENAKTSQSSTSSNPALAAANQAKFEVQATPPPIPTTKSSPPQGREWNDGVPVNTQGANARGKNCRMLLLREWLNIHCTGDVIGYEKKEDFGMLHEDYFEQIVLGKLASFVVRLRPGHHPKIRICRTNDRASLFVNWPPSKDFPTHVALGHGPPCDGSDWGVGYGQPGAAARPKSGSASAADDTAVFEAADREMRESARSACTEGIADACRFYCGKPRCP